MSKQSFSDNTYSLAKSLHHIHLAKQYFEDVRCGTNGDIKAIFNQYIQKCDWIISNVKDRLPQENRIALSSELEGSIDIEAIMDKLIHLDSKQKIFIESLINSLLKGEEIIITENKT